MIDGKLCSVENLTVNLSFHEDPTTKTCIFNYVLYLLELDISGGRVCLDSDSEIGGLF